jgi:hypothetical protein
MLMVDLFSGTGAVSQPWIEGGHRVIRVELAEGHDVRAIDAYPGATLIWASPPCPAYSLARPGCATRDPDLTLWQIALDIIHRSRPEYWIIENVCGAQRFWGRAPYHYGAWYLWGFYPPLPKGPRARHKMDSRDALERARVPTWLADTIYEKIIEDKTIRRIR